MNSSQEYNQMVYFMLDKLIRNYVQQLKDAEFFSLSASEIVNEDHFRRLRQVRRRPVKSNLPQLPEGDKW